MAKVTDVFNLFDFTEMVKEGFVRVQKHPADDNIRIANYTERAQFDRVWNDVTLNCRGLIYNYETWEVLARPFRKFFNWDESFVGKIPIGPMIKSPKMDGSLGILYPSVDNGFGIQSAFAIATRGSFASEQAKEGTRMFTPTALQSGFEPWVGCTYLFEIIYPENRIVVDYGDFRGLVLIDVIENETGDSHLGAFDAAQWPRKAEKVSVPSGFSVDLAHEIGDNEEGFVLYWPFHDLRVKMKGAEYVRLHRIVTGLDSVKVWEYLSTGKTVDDILNGAKVPDEFFAWLKQTAETLYRQHFEVLQQVTSEHDAIYSNVLHDGGSVVDDRELRKMFALRAKDTKYPAAQFALFDGKDINDLVWKICKPTRVAPFEDGGEN